MSAPTIPLNNGKTIPQIGFGTSPLNDKEVVPAVVAAIEAGYRHIDTAYRYNNERGVGLGIRDSGIDREDERLQAEFDDRRKIADEIVGLVLQHADIDRVAGGDRDERITVGRRLSGDADADDPVRPRAVIDDELCAQPFAQILRDHA